MLQSEFTLGASPLLCRFLEIALHTIALGLLKLALHYTHCTSQEVAIVYLGRSTQIPIGNASNLPRVRIFLHSSGFHPLNGQILHSNKSGAGQDVKSYHCCKSFHFVDLPDILIRQVYAGSLTLFCSTMNFCPSRIWAPQVSAAAVNIFPSASHISFFRSG